MTITLELTLEQEHLLRARVAQQDAQAVREILLQAIDSTVEGLLHTAGAQPQTTSLSALLAKVATGFRDAPALSDEAARAGIHADHL